MLSQYQLQVKKLLVADFALLLYRATIFNHTNRLFR